MNKIGPNNPCPCGKGKKYKKCCKSKDEEKEKIRKIIERIDIKKITRKDLLLSPFTNCPNCKNKKSYGLSPIGRLDKYTKECSECGYSQLYSLPCLNKKIIYLDQFVISNLVKLLDPSHRSHQEIKKDHFWENLFIKLEKLQDENLIICPDTFYHREESIASDIPFYLMEELYEHFSEGKTLLPHLVVYRNQIRYHFENWIKGEDNIIWLFNHKEISFENLNEWAFGLQVKVKNTPRDGERDKLKNSNEEIKKGLQKLWADWSEEKSVTYKERVEREILGFKELLFNSADQFKKNSIEIIEKAARGENVTEEFIEKIIPPMTNEILEDIFMIANQYCSNKEDAIEKINIYLSSPELLINVPSLKISSLMYAGFAHRANKSGQKRPPKSFNDVYFISAYLPYCDAMFIDRECELILKEVPQNLPEKYKMKYSTKIFSLSNKEDFLNYLDSIINSSTAEHTQAVKELTGGDRQPDWNIIIREKAEKEIEMEEKERNE